MGSGLAKNCQMLANVAGPNAQPSKFFILTFSIITLGFNYMPSDHDLVNFEEDYELNYVLIKVGKRQTQANRTVLVTMGKELKVLLGKRTVTHSEFFEYVKGQLIRLE